MGYFRPHNEYPVKMALKTIDSDLNKKIGAKLHRVRLRSGQLQYHVAIDLNFSTTTYSKHENGKVDFTVTKLKQLSDHFGVYIGDFFDDSVEIPRFLKEVKTGKEYMAKEAENILLREMLSTKLK